MALVQSEEDETDEMSPWTEVRKPRRKPANQRFNDRNDGKTKVRNVSTTGKTVSLADPLTRSDFTTSKAGEPASRQKAGIQSISKKTQGADRYAITQTQTEFILMTEPNSNQDAAAVTV